MNRSNYLSLTILLALAIVGPQKVHGQNQFIGNDKQIHPVIKLQTSDKSEPHKGEFEATSFPVSLDKITKAESSSATSNPLDIKYDSFDPKTSAKQPASTRVLTPIWTAPSMPATKAPAAKVKTSSGPMVIDLPYTEKVAKLAKKSANMVETTIRTPKFVNLNQPAEVEISLQNQGNDVVENAVLIVKIPMHAQLASTSIDPIQRDRQTLHFSIPRIGGKESARITMKLVPTQKQAMEIGTEILIKNIQRSTVAVRQPIINLSLAGPNQINIGRKATYELVVSNEGDGVATDIRLDTIFPPELKKLSESNGSFIRSIEPGKSVKVIYESQAVGPGKHRLNASAVAAGCDKNKMSLAFNVVQPELRVSAVGPKLNFVKRDGIYTIKIENSGVVDVTNTQITLRVPDGMNVTTISRKAGVDPEKGILTWNFDRIQARSNEQIQLKATALKPGKQVCNILVSSNETREKEILLATQVVTRADLSVRLKNVTGPVQVGTRAKFQVVVENSGSQKAEDINVQIVLPESLVAVNEEDQVTRPGDSVKFDKSAVEPGQKVTFNFTAVGVIKGEHVVRSVLEAQGTQRQIIAENMIYVYEGDQTSVSETISPVIPR